MVIINVVFNLESYNLDTVFLLVYAKNSPDHTHGSIIDLPYCTHINGGTQHWWMKFLLKLIVWCLGDAHVYSNHVSALKEQCDRDPRPFPTIHIKRKVDNIEEFNFEDFEVRDYNPHPKIAMEMAV